MCVGVFRFSHNPAAGAMDARPVKRQCATQEAVDRSRLLLADLYDAKSQVYLEEIRIAKRQRNKYALLRDGYANQEMLLINTAERFGEPDTGPLVESRQRVEDIEKIIEDNRNSRKRDPLTALPDELGATILLMAFPDRKDLVIASQELRMVSQKWHYMFKNTPSIKLLVRVHAHTVLAYSCAWRSIKVSGGNNQDVLQDRGLAVDIREGTVAPCNNLLRHLVDLRFSNNFTAVDPRGRGAVMVTPVEGHKDTVMVRVLDKNGIEKHRWGLQNVFVKAVAYYAAEHNSHKDLIKKEKSEGVPPNPYRVTDTRGTVAVLAGKRLMTFLPNGKKRIFVQHDPPGSTNTNLTNITSLVTCPSLTAYVCERKIVVVMGKNIWYLDGWSTLSINYLCYQPDRGLFGVDINGVVHMIIKTSDSWEFRRLPVPMCNRLFGLPNGGIVGALVYTTSKIERAYIF